MDQDDAVPIAELWEERRYLLDIAHWMLGSPGAAESAVDETYRCPMPHVGGSPLHGRGWRRPRVGSV